MRGWKLGVFLAVFCAACNSGDGSRGLTAERAAEVSREVKEFAGTVAHDVTQDGPAAWRKHFSDGPTFFMAVNGKLQFPDSASAAAGIQELTHMMRWEQGGTRLSKWRTASGWTQAGTSQGSPNAGTAASNSGMHIGQSLQQLLPRRSSGAGRYQIRFGVIPKESGTRKEGRYAQSSSTVDSTAMRIFIGLTRASPLPPMGQAINSAVWPGEMEAEFDTPAPLRPLYPRSTSTCCTTRSLRLRT
jgi:hypothetical protein